MVFDFFMFLMYYTFDIAVAVLGVETLKFTVSEETINTSNLILVGGR